MRKITPDKEKAKALVKMAEKIMERVLETNEEKFPSQVTKDYYEALHSLMESLASQKGVKSQGEGAHEKLINWIIKELKLAEKEKDLLYKLRKHRNKITYEGFNIQHDFLERNKDEIINIYEKLKREIKT